MYVISPLTINAKFRVNGFKLTHCDLAMLTRYAIVGEAYSASQTQCSIVTGTEHI